MMCGWVGLHGRPWVGGMRPVLVSSSSQQLRNPRLEFRLMRITNYRFILTSKGADKQVMFSLKIIAHSERYLSDIFDNEKKSNK